MAKQRWNLTARKETESQLIDSYLREIIDVGRRYGFSLSHEDTQGAFVVCDSDAENEEWLNDAHDGTGIAHGGPKANSDLPKTDWRIR